jgi:hypothetical protein
MLLHRTCSHIHKAFIPVTSAAIHLPTIQPILPRVSFFVAPIGNGISQPQPFIMPTPGLIGGLSHSLDVLDPPQAHEQLIASSTMKKRREKMNKHKRRKLRKSLRHKNKP